MSDIAEQLNEAAKKATRASAQAEAWVTGPVGTTVPTDSGPVPTIAEFTRAAQKRADDAIDALGWVLAGNFTAGCTVTARNQYVLVIGDARYRWDGALPKVVAPGSSPTPIATGAWMLTNTSVITMPTPDVSIPFSTDGRMTHGKGAPVLVGTTTVAQLVNYERLGSQTMIDKSGRLVTVPAGEMAIEQQGLAIFDQSVNLIAPSINWVGAMTASPWVHSAKDSAGWITVSGAGSGAAAEGSFVEFDVPTADVAHTFSLDILKTAGMQVRIQVQDSSTGRPMITITESGVSGEGSGSVYDMGSFWRVELSFSFLSTTYRKFRIYPFGVAVGATGSMTYRRVQLEAKPFATPYIENATSAQTTRPATTKCDIPWGGNLLPINDNQALTVSLEFDTAGGPLATARHTIFTESGGTGQYMRLRVETGLFLQGIRSATFFGSQAISARRKYKACLRINKNVCDLFIDGVKNGTSVTSAPLSGGLPGLLRFGCSHTAGYILNGHIRSVSIWNSALTDVQCQAASS